MKQKKESNGILQTFDSFSCKLATTSPIIISALLAVFFFPYCFSSHKFQSWDLHGHIAITERIATQLLHGRIFFYDPWWFTGWPVSTFYPPLTHLLAAALSLFLSLFSAEPARLSCQILLGLSLSFLPFSMHVVASRICEKRQLFVCFSTALFSVWFLSHPEASFGLGEQTGIRLGLLPQVIAWHILLFFVAEVVSVARFSETQIPKRKRLSLTLLTAALLLTHTLTFIFAALFAALLFFWRRIPFQGWLSLLLGICLCSTWLIPATLLSRQYAPLDELPSNGDILALLFRITPQNAFRTLLPPYNGTLSLAPGLLLISLFFLLHRQAKKHSLLLSCLFFALFTTFFVTSDFFFRHFPFRVHFYRFIGVGQLVLLCFIASIPSIITATNRRLNYILSFVFILALGNEIVVSRNDPNIRPVFDAFQEEEKLLHALAQKPEDLQANKRVLFEHPLGKYPDFPSPHYLFSSLVQRETVNGLFIQSSKTQAFFTAIAAQLKLDYYGTPELDTADERFDGNDFVSQLKDFGVSTVVSVKPPESSALAAVLSTSPQSFGPFFVYQLGEAAPVVQSSSRRVVGYFDMEGSLPFTTVEYVFTSQKDLLNNIDLLALQDDIPVPPEMTQILVNDLDDEHFKQTALLLTRNSVHRPLIRRLRFPKQRKDSKDTQQQAQLNLLNNARQYLLGQTHLDAKLIEHPGAQAFEASSPEIRFDWDNQKIILTKLTPNRLVRINYSYFPYWVSDSGQIFRGVGERMWFLPQQESATLSYNPFAHRYVLSGVAVSLLSMLACYLLLRQPARSLSPQNE